MTDNFFIWEGMKVMMIKIIKMMMMMMMMIIMMMMKGDTSVAAVNEHGEILALRLGQVRRRGMWAHWIIETLLFKIMKVGMMIIRMMRMMSRCPSSTGWCRRAAP